MSESTPDKRWFRVHFHDGKTFDFCAGHPLIAEKKARAAHPGGFVKKVKLIREEIRNAG
ncbi:hypothetical protein ACLJYM_14600 [Rhizobium giardinii]|uniref:hypothetical protein n=1 Tax=Rhizobium giardinii TaxID=56731 RepID=UPI0039E00C61